MTVREKGKVVRKLVPVVKRILVKRATQYRTETHYGTRFVTTPGGVRVVREPGDPVRAESPDSRGHESRTGQNRQRDEILADHEYRDANSDCRRDRGTDDHEYGDGNPDTDGRERPDGHRHADRHGVRHRHRGADQTQTETQPAVTVTLPAVTVTITVPIGP